MKKQVIQQAKRQYQRKKKNAENLSFNVIGKEIELENMVKKEEQLKEQLETQKIEETIKKEEYKAQCLEKAFEERELDDEFQEVEHESMDEINEVHTQARKKISESRLKLKRSIQKMKMKSKTQNQSLSQHLKQIRSKMTKEIMLANKNGNVGNCRRGRKDMDFRESYCNKNFTEDWTRNSDCKGEEFCYTCCENEFGAMYVRPRDNCYKMCDYKPKQVKVQPPKGSTAKGIRVEPAKENESAAKTGGEGKWVWAPRELAKGKK